VSSVSQPGALGGADAAEKTRADAVDWSAPSDDRAADDEDDDAPAAAATPRGAAPLSRWQMPRIFEEREGSPGSVARACAREVKRRPEFIPAPVDF
jgi:hypothetical protein